MTLEAKRRTHLANERTYAAWIRTALALVALGAAFSVGGAFMAALATYGYRWTYRSIEEGEYGGSAALTVVLGAIR